MSSFRDNEPIRIKKYENRRLYSSTAGRHLTLAEVASLVREGREILVHDATSGADITSEILTQILLEQGRARTLPVEFLLHLIRLQEDLVEGFVARALTGGLELLVQTQKSAAQVATKAVEELAKSAVPFWMRRGATNREKELEREIANLKSRITELESRKKSKSSKNTRA